jgi:hypothetical protein
VQGDARKLTSQVCEAIVHAFSNIQAWTPSEQKSSAFWTGKLHAAMEALSGTLNLDVRILRKAPRNWPFLYDVAFLETADPRLLDGSGYFRPEVSLKRLVIALESEWLRNPEEIIDDFTKLLVARATLHILVFCPTTAEDADAILERVAAVIRDFRDSDPKDVYLVCAITAAAPRCMLFNGSGGIHPLPPNEA